MHTLVPSEPVSAQMYSASTAKAGELATSKETNNREHIVLISLRKQRKKQFAMATEIEFIVISTSKKGFRKKD